jgi:hypothetical protein
MFDPTWDVKDIARPDRDPFEISGRFLQGLDPPGKRNKGFRFRMTVKRNGDAGRNDAAHDARIVLPLV